MAGGRAPSALRRQMKVFGALLLTLSAVTPAASVYVIIPGIIQQAGSGALISLILSGVIGLAMAFVYAELAAAHPIAGGEYSIYGRTMGPLVGFAYMGMNVIGAAFSPAVLALGASAYLDVVWPHAPSLPVAVAIIGLATGLGVLNIRTNALVTGLFLLLEIAVLAVLTGLGFWRPARGMGELVLHPVILNAAGSAAPVPLAVIGLGMAVAIYAFDGFGSAVYFSEEMVGAPRRMARTILIALLLSVGLELVPTVAVLMGAPDLKRLLASATPFSDFVAVRGGPTLAGVVSLGVVMAIVNAMIALILMNARFFYASGRDRAWPAQVNAALLHLHPRFGSPWVATLLSGALAAAGCLIPFRLLLVLTGAGLLVTYGLLCIGVLAGRRNGSTAHGPYRMPLYPLAPVFGLAALVYVVYANWIDAMVGRPSLIATAVLIGAGIVYALAMRRRRGKGWVIVEPKPEAAAD